MSTGLTRAAVARHPFTLLGPAATQLLAAVIVTVSFLTLRAVSDHDLPAAIRTTIDAHDVGTMSVAFLLLSVYLSMLVVGLTTAAGLARQRRAIALVRTIGATPGQVRRSIARQSVVTALPAAVLGAAIGSLTAPGWMQLMRTHGIVPAAVRVSPSAAALPVALAVVLPTSVIGALVAGLRVSRARPSRALTETGVGRRTVGWPRAGLGALTLAGAVTMSVLVSRRDPADAADAALLVLLALCVGVGLLGPALLRGLMAVPLLRVAGGAGGLARDNLRVLSRPLSTALVPATLAAAFALVKIGAHTTARRAGLPDDPAASWLDYTGTGVYVAFAAVATVAVLAATTSGRRSELTRLLLAGATRLGIARIALLEAVAVSLTAMLCAAAVAALTLVPLVRGTVGVARPYLPPAVLASVAVGLLVLVAVTGVGSALVAVRRPGRVSAA